MDTHAYDLDYHENIQLTEELKLTQKSTAVGILLALFLGGFGAQRFYLGDTMVAVIFIALTCVTYFLLGLWYVPALICLIEAVLMPARIKKWNDGLALTITKGIIRDRAPKEIKQQQDH